MTDSPEPLSASDTFIRAANAQSATGIGLAIPHYLDVERVWRAIEPFVAASERPPVDPLREACCCEGAPRCDHPCAYCETHLASPATPRPEGLDDLIARIERAEQEVSDLCSGKRRWTMTVPAELDRDSDLLIGGALADARKALARLSDTGERP